MKPKQFNNILRLINLGIAIAALVIALQNRAMIKFLEAVQDNVIEQALFPELQIKSNGTVRQ
jgi:hypothetical protein